MLDTAGQSSQALMFCLRYDFPTEWSAFVNGPANANFAVTLQKEFFPYMAQSASQVTIDTVTLYAESDGKVAQWTPPNVGFSLPYTFKGTTVTAPLSLPTDGTFIKQDASQQVFLVLQYHFGDKQ